MPIALLLVETVVTRHVERGLPPPVPGRDTVVEPRAYRMTDEHVLGREGPGHAKQRAAPESFEVEGGALWITDDFAGQQVVEAAALFEMTDEGEEIPQEPRARARHRR